MLDPSGILVVGGLFVISAMLVFYLGHSFGKSKRLVDPLNNFSLSSAKNNADIAVAKIKDDTLSLAQYNSKIDQLDSALKVSPNFEAQNPPVKTNKEGPQKYIIQLSSSTNLDSANQLLRQLKDDNYDAYVINNPLGDGNTEYKVMVGNGLEKDELDRELAQLTAKYAGVLVPSVQIK